MTTIMESLDVTLCIFAKVPRAGTVKTRLAASIGAEPAARLAEAFLRDTLSLARDFPSARVVLALAGGESETSFEDANVPVWAQGDGDLGDRMERTMRRALAETPCVLALGTDSPGLPRRFIEGALETLETHDAVIGPADDGGFYLLGLRECQPGLLRGLPWSASETCSRTLARLTDRGLRVGVIPGWFDVDTAQDLKRLDRLLASGEIIAPLTRSVLQELELEGLS